MTFHHHKGVTIPDLVMSCYVVMLTYGERLNMLSVAVIPDTSARSKGSVVSSSWVTCCTGIYRKAKKKDKSI